MSNRFVKQLRYLLALLAGATGLILVGVLYLLGFSAKEIAAAVVPNLIATSLSFIAVYFVLERRGIITSNGQLALGMDHRLELHTRHDKMDWGSVIRSAEKRVDIVVFYYGNWFSALHDEFVSFFQKGGTLTLVMSDPSNAPLMRMVQEHFFEALTPDELANKVANTVSAVERALKDSHSTAAKFECLYFPRALHYSFVLIDNRRLYVSPYEQFRHPTVRAPVFEVDLSIDKDSERYWIDVRDRFIAGSVKNAAAATKVSEYRSV